MSKLYPFSTPFCFFVGKHTTKFLYLLALHIFLCLSLSAQDQILFSIASNNTIYTANLDGTGTPTPIINPATAGIDGPIGISADHTNDLLYIAGGNQEEFYTTPLSGGAGTVIPNSTGLVALGFDVYVDVPNDRYFFSTLSGVRVASTDGTGGSTSVRTSGTSLDHTNGIDYDPATDIVYAGDKNNSRIVAIDVATGVASTLFNAADGVTQPRGLSIDPINGLVYWTQHVTPPGSGKRIMVGNLDGSGAPTQLFSAGFLPHGILVDYTTGLLYWAEFSSGSNSRVMVANADGTGTPTILHNLSGTARIRGLEFGQPLMLPPKPIPTLGQWGLILLTLLLLTFSTVAIVQRQMGVKSTASHYPLTIQHLPFNKELFMRLLAGVLVAAFAVFALAIALFGYELTNTDVPGTLVCAPILAYLLSLAWVKN